MTLLTSNTATGMMFATLLAVLFLGEVFVCKYDFIALVLIITGSVLTVLQSDMTEKSYDSIQVATLLTSPKAIIFIVLTLVLHCLTIFSVLW